MNNNKEPIFKEIFGNSWHDLPIVMKKHYSNHPYSNNIAIAKGKMDIKFNWFGRLCAPLFVLFQTLVPHQGNNIKTTVQFTSDPHNNHLGFNRTLSFPNKKSFHFNSKMVPIGNGPEVIEFMKFGLGWRTNYAYENDLVKLKHLGYVLRIFGCTMPVPLSFFLGKGYAQEKALSDDSFEMLMTITHPLWGIIYQYNGTFNMVET